ncbi:MAG TPA: PAS domain S-box protein [Candidatus Binataceae bacterium]|nr:PAS domain S-box protein [Candidatus Binataceae bacterium]
MRTDKEGRMIASAPIPRNNRVLIIDDNRAIQDDFRKILGDQDPLRAAEARLFGTPLAVSFQMEFAAQGQEGLQLVEQALAAGNPYSMAFVDVRMPPGWDGIETTRRIWEVDPDLQIVICTAYSDYSWDELRDVLGQPDRLLILKKPFDTIEVVQLAHALTDKWRLLQESKRTVAALEQAVAERTAELASSNGALQLELEKRGVIEAMLREAQEKLEERVKERTQELNHVNAALDEHAIVAVTDPQGKILSINDKFCAVSKYSREELIGRDHRIVNSGHHTQEFYRDLWTTIGGGQVWKGEIRNRAKDGSLYWVDTTIVPFLHETGTPTQYVAIHADITERKRAEEALAAGVRILQESERRLRFLAETMPQMVWTATPDGNVDYYNQRWYDYTGMSFEQTRDWGWQAVLHPEDLQNCVARWTESVTTGCGYQVEYRFKRAADGLYRWHLGRAFPMRNDQGAIMQWVGTCTDIDDYKRTQEALREAHAGLEARVAERTAELDAAKGKLQGVLDAATQLAIIATDADRLITVFSAGAERMLGYGAAEMVGKKTSAALHLEAELIEHARALKERFGRTNPGFDRLVENASHGKSEEREWTYVRKNGSHLTVNLTLTALLDANGKPVGFLGVASDVTERKRAEKALRESRESLALATRSARIGIWDWDVVANKLVWDARMYELYGIHEQDFSGAYDAWQGGLHPQDRERGDAAIHAALDGIKDFSIEFRVVWPNGETHHIEGRALVQRAADGSAARMIGVNWDITERKRGEVDLERVRAELVQGIADATAANDALQLQTEKLRRLNKERETLANLSELLAACAEPEEAYAIFAGAATGLFPSLAGVLHMYGPARDQLVPATVWGEWPVAAPPVGAKECWGLRRGKSYIGTGTTTPPCAHAGPAQGLATLCVPLMAYGEVLGVLHLRGPDASTLQSSLQLASTASDGLALTLANLKLRESLKEESIRDPLTALFNRRYLSETLAREFARARRAGAPLAVVMLDVDHFKRFNDRFGHSAGDVVLRELGAFLKRSIRADDLACRYGGEEFCLILPQTGRDGAQQRAESIRAGVARLALKSEGGALEPVTLSLGVALFPEDGDSAESLMRAADVALYQAKREGRNRVVMSQATELAGDIAAADVLSA